MGRIQGPSPWAGCASISIVDRTVASGPTYTFVGDLEYARDPVIKRGATIGRVVETGARAFGTYQLVFTVGAGGIDEKLLQRMFPLAFTRAATRVSYDGPQGGGIITNPRYFDSPLPTRSPSR